MEQVKANTLSTIPLGRQGENLARQILFDVSGWESEYGPGSVELIAQRPGEAQPYPVAVHRNGTIVTWDVSSTDTEMPGDSGKCELRYYVGEVLAKSKPWQTWVETAMDTPSETAPPEPEQGWVDQIIAVGAAAKASADAAKADADRAAALAAEVAEKAAQTAKNASDAAKAMKAAQTAQRLAEEAQRAAKAARTAAAAAQAAAETAATDAAGAKKDAETAQKAAQDAAAAAANTLESIQTLYQEMQTWAQGVIQDVNDAGSVAVRSVQTAGDTQVQRVIDEGTTQTANAKAQADDAKLYADEAKQSATDAHTAKTAAETAMDAAVTAQSKADAAQKGAEDAKSEAEASEEASASNAATAMLSAQNAKDSEDAAKASEDNAAQSATDAQAAMTAAQAAQSGAEAAQSAAAQSAQEAAGSASTASTSETNAKASEESAKASQTAAQASQTAAAGSASAAANSAASASASASAASESAAAAAASETAAKASEKTAKASETAAKASETAADGSASAAQQSAKSAAESAAVYDDVVADVNQLKQDLTGLQAVVDSKADKTELAKTNLYLDALYKLNKGQTYDVLQQESEAYSVDVLSGSHYMGIDKVGGKSVVWNQKFDILKTYTTAFDGNFEVIDNKIVYKSQASVSGNRNLIQFFNNSSNDGHKYYASAKVTNNSKQSIPIRWLLDFSSIMKTVSIKPNETVRVRDIRSYNYTLGIRLQRDNAAQATDELVFEEIMFYDLTQMFGEGNEPSTVEEFEAMFPADYYPYSEPTIISSQTDRVDVASADGTISQQITTNFPALNSAGSVYDYIDLNEGKLYTWTYIDGNEIKALTEPVITDITIPTELTDWLTVETGCSVTFHNADDGKRLLIPNKLSFVRKLDEVTV